MVPVQLFIYGSGGVRHFACFELASKNNGQNSCFDFGEWWFQFNFSFMIRGESDFTLQNLQFPRESVRSTSLSSHSSKAIPLFRMRQFHFNFWFMVQRECDFRCPNCSLRHFLPRVAQIVLRGVVLTGSCIGRQLY